jgi:hypothetical protein
VFRNAIGLDRFGSGVPTFRRIGSAIAGSKGGAFVSWGIACL